MKQDVRKFTYPLLGFLIPFAVIAFLIWSKRAVAAPSPNAKPAASAASGKKTTDVNFEDVLVQGKYHFSDEAVTTVEEDKVLDSLLGVRKDFKDRIKKSVSRQ